MIIIKDYLFILILYFREVIKYLKADSFLRPTNVTDLCLPVNFEFAGHQASGITLVSTSCCCICGIMALQSADLRYVCGLFVTLLLVTAPPALSKGASVTQRQHF